MERYQNKPVEEVAREFGVKDEELKEIEKSVEKSTLILKRRFPLRRHQPEPFKEKSHQENNTPAVLCVGGNKAVYFGRIDIKRIIRAHVAARGHFAPSWQYAFFVDIRQCHLRQNRQSSLYSGLHRHGAYRGNFSPGICRRQLAWGQRGDKRHRRDVSGFLPSK